ncbi:MAG: ATP-binding protein [Candidatus Melainabacteria bacterium]|nr:ATP-binding protein [Candidatus Melainabacteria bacterium]
MSSSSKSSGNILSSTPALPTDGDAVESFHGGHASTPAVTATNQSQARLEALLSHLSTSHGLFSKATFLGLAHCVTRIIRDQNLGGLVLARTNGDADFQATTLALEHRPGLRLYRTDAISNTQWDLSAQTGFLVVLTNRLCATIYWTSETDDTFRMYEGGWTFHPSDTRTIATHLLEPLEDAELMQALENTPVDRRYDDKLNLLSSSLIHGLETRNRELTMALERESRLHKRVVESERMAAVGQLCSVIAHEIRNPLGLIDLYAKLVETQIQQQKAGHLASDPEAEGKLLKNLGMIRSATQNLETILSELTDYARPLTLKLETSNLAKLVAETTEFYRPSYEEKGVRLLLKLPRNADCDQSFEMPLDVGRIRQSLINFLKNALEASSKDTTVTVTLASRKQDAHFYVKVADEGPGIAPEVAPKLFTPYFSTKEQGTGLGLAHVRKILQAHGGNAELLRSKPGEGATFALTLPKPVH